MKNKRYSGLDILKFICSFLIICIHVPFPGSFGKYFCALCRVAVPIFFMITGFFYDDTKKHNKEKNQIYKIFKLLFFSNVVYLIFNVIISILNNSLKQYILTNISLKSILNFVLFNESPFGLHLWYLGAIFYVLIIYLFLEKIFGKNSKKIFYILTPFLLVGDLIFGKYSILLFNREFSYIFVRNFLFVGIPYFSIGMFIKEKINKIKSINNIKYIILIFIFIITTFLERFILDRCSLNATRDHYISTTLLSIVLFIYFIYNDKFKLNFIKNIGKNLSTFIYIIHPMIIILFNSFLQKLNIGNYYLYVYSIIIFIISIVISKILKKYILK